VESHYCYDDTGCEVMGQLKDFKICPLCKTAWYCASRARNMTINWVALDGVVHISYVK
jgi:hypothetical protein